MQNKPHIFYTKTLTHYNKVLAVVHWRNYKTVECITKLCNNDAQVNNFLKTETKNIIVGELTRFINHRERIIQIYGCTNRMSALKAIEIVRISLERYSDLLVLCKWIVNNDAILNRIMPGQSSTFLKNYTITLNNILLTAKTIINGQVKQ